jgi:hypothetical protein
VDEASCVRLERTVYDDGTPRTLARGRKALGSHVASCYAFVPEMRSFYVACLLACLLGCGRKATRADCEAVVDKNVEVKLKAEGIADPSVIDKRKAELRASLRDDIDRCVGKRVTDGMLSCVKGAETAEQIDKCLR